MLRWILASTLLLAGCSSPDFACDVTQTQGGVTSHACTEIDDLPDVDVDLEGLCSQLKGTLVGSCPSDGDLGICAQTAGGLTQNIHFYSTGGLTPALAEQACQQVKGTWTAN